MRSNKLRLNSDKTEILLVWKSTIQVLEYFPALNGVVLPLKNQVSSLVFLPGFAAAPGCPRDSCGEGGLCRALAGAPGVYLGHAEMATVIHGTMTLRLGYYNAFYMGLPLKIARKLQLVQNAVTHVITESWWFNSIRLLL